MPPTAAITMTSTATHSSIIAAIDQVVGNATRPVALHEPYFSGNEKKYLNECIDSGWVSSVGTFVDRFERELADFCGAKYAVVAVNGTCALHAALVTMGVKPGDEVLLPSLTFVATANAVTHAGATPHFVDIEESSLGVDPVALEKYLSHHAEQKNNQTINKKTGRTIRAVVSVDVFGHPCQMEALHTLAQKWHLHIIEDATEALGSLTHGKKIGSVGTAIFSFNGNKIITTGGGGAITTNDEILAKKLKHLTTTARVPHAYQLSHDAVAWNYRLPNLNAALGCAQLETLPRMLAAKRALAARYIDAFKNVLDVKILAEPQGTASNYWLVTLMVENADDALFTALHEKKLLCRPCWTPLHRLPMYKDSPRAPLPLTETLAPRIISLPSSAKLGLAYV